MTLERPILFSGPMVRAILDGRKTQTRRIVKAAIGNRKLGGFVLDSSSTDRKCKTKRGDILFHDGEFPITRNDLYVRNPFGQPGDRLWVKESWSIDFQQCVDNDCGPAWYGVHVRYDADKKLEWVDAPSDDWERLSNQPYDRKRSSIHMFRWASRLLLEIVSVRVERLTDITDDDAVSEGIDDLCMCGSMLSSKFGHEGHGFTRAEGFAHREFRHLWDSINGEDSWNSNPWVWVIEFKVVKC